MKNLLALITVLLACVLFTAAVPRPDYSYYIKDFYDDAHASEGYSTMLDANGRIKRLNLPPDVLADIDTESLVKSLLNNGFFIIHTFAFNTPAAGIDSLRGRVTALDELESRPDAAKAVLKIRTELYETDKSQIPDGQKGEHEIKLKLIDALLAEKFIQAQLVENHI
jgi:hypothetical protein